jgi:hypothetical protein
MARDLEGTVMMAMMMAACVTGSVFISKTNFMPEKYDMTKGGNGRKGHTMNM